MDKKIEIDGVTFWFEENYLIGLYDKEEIPFEVEFFQLPEQQNMIDAIEKFFGISLLYNKNNWVKVSSKNSLQSVSV